MIIQRKYLVFDSTPFEQFNNWQSIYNYMNEPLLLFMKKKGFNVTQGMALLLLKPLNLPANYVLNLIIYITNPRNNIGY